MGLKRRKFHYDGHIASLIFSSGVRLRSRNILRKRGRGNLIRWCKDLFFFEDLVSQLSPNYTTKYDHFTVQTWRTLAFPVEKEGLVDGNVANRLRWGELGVLLGENAPETKGDPPSFSA